MHGRFAGLLVDYWLLKFSRGTRLTLSQADATRRFHTFCMFLMTKGRRKLCKLSFRQFDRLLLPSVPGPFMLCVCVWCVKK